MNERKKEKERRPPRNNKSSSNWYMVVLWSFTSKRNLKEEDWSWYRSRYLQVMSLSRWSSAPISRQDRETSNIRTAPSLSDGYQLRGSSLVIVLVQKETKRNYSVIPPLFTNNIRVIFIAHSQSCMLLHGITINARICRVYAEYMQSICIFTRLHFTDLLVEMWKEVTTVGLRETTRKAVCANW